MSRRWATLAVFAVISLAVPLLSARAAITPAGDVSPSNPSAWTTSTTGYIGLTGSGSLTVDGGSDLISGNGYLGYQSTAKGVVNIAGAGSKWDNDAFYIGYYGSGTLSITNGGIVNSTYPSYVNGRSGTASVVTVDGAGSMLNSFDLDVGDTGSATLHVSNGGRVSSRLGLIGWNVNSVGVATVDGTGSIWNNRGYLNVGSPGYGAVGILSITGGGAVTATTVSIGTSQSVLAVDVGRGSLLSVGGGTGTISNSDTLRILAGAGVPVDVTKYSPVSAGTWTGTGTYQPVGGTWNTTSHTFTASSVTSGTSGTPVALDLASVQRALVSDNGSGGTGWVVGASFLAKPTSTPLNFTGTVMNTDTLNSLQGLLAPGQSVLSGWNFSADAGYTPDDPIYFSFKVGSGLNP